jgi:hypothetical protein
MRTDELIRALGADGSPPPVSMARGWEFAALAAMVLAAAVFFATLGPRPDIASAVETVRFLFKPLVALVLAGTAFAAVRVMARPGADDRAAILRLLLAPALLVLAVVVELVVVPSAGWHARLVGSNALVCLLAIPLIGIGPLAAFLLVLRHGAATRPALAGAASGLLAGGIAAAFYAIHCPDDSPLFVATWYTAAVLVLTTIGALLAPRLARW